MSQIFPNASHEVTAQNVRNAFAPIVERVWTFLEGEIGDLTQLQTVDKQSVVNAINAVLTKMKTDIDKVNADIVTLGAKVGELSGILEGTTQPIVFDWLDGKLANGSATPIEDNRWTYTVIENISQYSKVEGHGNLTYRTTGAFTWIIVQKQDGTRLYFDNLSSTTDRVNNPDMDWFATTTFGYELDVAKLLVAFPTAYKIFFCKYAVSELNWQVPSETSEGLADKANRHISSKANPHNVTKEQIGLNNVDNTSDLDKPMSKAVSAEIDKLSKIINGTATTIQATWQSGRLTNGSPTPSVNANFDYCVIDLDGVSQVKTDGFFNYGSRGAYSCLIVTDSNDTRLDFDNVGSESWVMSKSYVTTTATGYVFDIEALRVLKSSASKLYLCRYSNNTIEAYSISGSTSDGLVNQVEHLDERVTALEEGGGAEEIKQDVENIKKDLYGTSTRVEADWQDGRLTNGNPTPSIVTTFNYCVFDITNLTKIVSDGLIGYGSRGAYSCMIVTDETNARLDFVNVSNAEWSSFNREYVIESPTNYEIDIKKLRLQYPTASYIYLCRYSNVTTTWTAIETAEEGALDIVAKLAESIEEYKIVLPSEDTAVVGREWNLYYNSVVIGLNDTNYIKVSVKTISNPGGGKLENSKANKADYGTVGRYSCANLGDCFRVVAKSNDAGLYTITLELKRKTDSKTIVSASMDLNVIENPSLPNINLLCIGDSLTDDGWYPAEIQAHLSGGRINCIGTMTDTKTFNASIGSQYTDSVVVHNEGRGGWSADDYTTKANVGSVVNAFWFNGKFDFSSYMSTNGFNVDVVSIYLGTNGNKTSESLLDSLDIIVNSIRQYSQTVKILICLMHHSAEQEGCGYYARVQDAVSLSNSHIKQNEKTTEHYKDMPNVYICPLNFGVDSKNDYPFGDEVRVSERNPIIVRRQQNNVHPLPCGYFKMADSIYNTIANLYK